MKAMIIDDDIEFLESIKGKIQTLFDREQQGWEVNAADSYNSVVKYLDSEDIDIVFLDIDMPQKNGIEIAEMLREKNRNIDIIFLTNREDLVFQSIHYAPFRFIRKSKVDKELGEAVRAYVRRYIERNSLLVYEENNKQETVFLKNIYYIESEKHYLRLHTKNGLIVFRGKIADYEEFLQKNGFIRTQRSYMINMMYVKCIFKDKILMVNEDEVPIKRGFTMEIKREYFKYSENQ